MGYVSKDIAVITEPKKISLTGSPNFVVFESKPVTKRYLWIEIGVKVIPSMDLPSVSVLQISDSYGNTRVFKGTTTAEEAGGYVFFVSDDTSDTAENLRQAMMSDDWLRTNFEIVIPFVSSVDGVTNGSRITIRSKDAGKEYNMTISGNSTGYTIDRIIPDSYSNDSISGDNATAEIELDIYDSPPDLFGVETPPTNATSMGEYITSLSKTYSGTPLWFELNSLFSQYAERSTFPESPGWFGTRTHHKYRFLAKVKGNNSFYFYCSSVLYVINGYGPVFEELDLTPYVYNGDVVKLLTNKPLTKYVRGQREFLNFVCYSKFIGIRFRIAYQVYSTGHLYLGTVYGQESIDNTLVRTCRLDIDTALDLYPNAGIVKVALAKGDSLISDFLEYEIIPECLHRLAQFSFVNRLGGWDNVNFDAPVQDELRNEVETYDKTLTPYMKKGDSLETVYNANLANTFTVEGAPISDEVAEWLKEMAASTVVVDNDGNYIIVEEFTLSKTADNFNMQRPTIKYHLTE